MKIKGRIMRLRDKNGGAQFEAGPVEFKMSENEGNLIFEISKRDLIAGDELRLDVRILEVDNAG